MRVEDTIRQVNPLEQSHARAPGVIESCLAIYIFSFVAHDIKLVYINGLRDFMSRAYNLVTFAMTSMFLCVIALRLAAYCEVVSILAEGKTVDETRENWTQFDPIIVSEGLLACASILAVLRFTELFTVLHGLGPLMISIGKTVS